jgi:hypothetical protein
MFFRRLNKPNYRADFFLYLSNLLCFWKALLPAVSAANFRAYSPQLAGFEVLLRTPILKHLCVLECGPFLNTVVS